VEEQYLSRIIFLVKYIPSLFSLIEVQLFFQLLTIEELDKYIPLQLEIKSSHSNLITYYHYLISIWFMN
jgi:hypothetical protein